MLRDDNLNLRPTPDETPVWPVLTRSREAPRPAADTAANDTSVRPEEATPDVPAVIGLMLFGIYFALVAALAIATAGPGESKFMLTISALFVVAFFTVPRFIFAQEPRRGPRPSLHRFLRSGMATLTGHCSGRAALVQMFIVPAALTCGMLLIALEIALIF